MTSKPLPMTREKDYRSFDDAIRDGWYVSFNPSNPWWRPDAKPALSYSVTAKKGDWHVELGGNSLAELRRAVRMLKSVPRPDIPFGREWWRTRP